MGTNQMTQTPWLIVRDSAMIKRPIDRVIKTVYSRRSLFYLCWVFESDGRYTDVLA